jgi:hypothetical protein
VLLLENYFCHKNRQGKVVFYWTEMLLKLELVMLGCSRCCIREDEVLVEVMILLSWNNRGWERRVNYLDSLWLVTDLVCFLRGWRNFIVFVCFFSFGIKNIFFLVFLLFFAIFGFFWKLLIKWRKKSAYDSPIHTKFFYCKWPSLEYLEMKRKRNK